MFNKVRTMVMLSRVMWYCEIGTWKHGFLDKNGFFENMDSQGFALNY